MTTEEKFQKYFQRKRFGCEESLLVLSDVVTQYLNLNFRYPFTYIARDQFLRRNLGFVVVDNIRASQN